MTNRPSSSRILSALAVSAGFLVLGTFAPVAALATTSPGANLSVTASIAQNCLITAPAALSFSAYDPVVTNKTSPLNVSASLVLTCTKGASNVSVSLSPSSAGTTVCGTAPQRCLTDGTTGQILTYQLSALSYGGTAWTSAVPGVSETPSGVSAPLSIAVYGQIGAGQDANVGSYTDTIVATANY